MNHQESGSCGCSGHKILKVIGITIVGVTIAIAFAFIFSIAVMYLWNWLAPEIFDLKQINFWQAFGIIILSKLLFGGLFCKHGEYHKDHKQNIGKKIHDKIHKKFDPYYCCGNDEKVNKNYQKFWEDEGKRAFEDYLQKIDKE